MLIPFILNHLGSVLLCAFVCAYLAGVYAGIGLTFALAWRLDGKPCTWLEQVWAGMFWLYYFWKDVNA